MFCTSEAHLILSHPGARVNFDWKAESTSKLTRKGSLQGWDLALTVLQSYRDALPQTSEPDATNGRLSFAMRQEGSLQQSASGLTVHLLVVDVIATSYKGNNVCLH